MVRLNEMSREELLEVIAIKDATIRVLREEIQSYQELLKQITGSPGQSDRQF